MDRSTYLKFLSSLFLKGHRLALRLQNQSTLTAPANGLDVSPHPEISIVISTFQDRFETYALPLIRSIRSVSNWPITLIINGNLDSLIDTEKLKNFLNNVSDFSQIYPVTFQSFQGCAKMWNTGILNSDTEIVLILNDDVTVVSDNFVSDVSKAVNSLSETNILTFNSSWSHFLINKTAVKDYGWFDEYLLGIGNEDGEYAERYTRLTGNYIPTLGVSTFINISDSSRDQSVASNESKYSLFNSVLNQLRHEDFSIPFGHNPYPLYEWQRKMRKWLSVNDLSAIKKAIKTEIKKS